MTFPSISLHSLVQVLQEYPGLYQGLTFQDVEHFLHLAILLKPYLALAQSFYSPAPLESLPSYVHDFLGACLQLNDDILKLLWLALRDAVWNVSWDEYVVAQRDLAQQYLPYFLREGLTRGISKYSST